MKNRNLPLALCSVLVLSACGGGGGGDSGGASAAAASTASVITSANANKVAGNAYAGTIAISESSAPLSSLLTGVSVGGKISVVKPAIDLIRNAYSRSAGQLLTGVTISETEACSGGGSVTIDAKISNEDMASNGDTIAMTARNCVEAGLTINGSVSATLSNVTGDVFNSWNWSANLNTVFTNFAVTSGSETASGNGDMTIAIAQTSSSSHSVTLSGKSLQTSMQRAGVSLGNFALTDYSMKASTNGTTTSSAATFAMTGSANGLDQFSYSVKNLQPFVSNGTSMPSSGSLIVNGNSSSVTLTALSSSTVRIDHSDKGDGAITHTTSLGWSELLAAI